MHREADRSIGASRNNVLHYVGTHENARSGLEGSSKCRVEGEKRAQPELVW